MGEISGLVDLLTRGGFATIVVLLIVGGMRGTYIWGSTHKEIVARLEKQVRDAQAREERWMAVALKGSSIAGDLSSIIVQTATKE